MKMTILALLACAAATFPALAEGDDEHSHSSTPVPAYMEENAAGIGKMRDSMMKGAMSNSPDEAFVRAMIPMHQGAMDMARIQLKYGKDAQAKKWAADQIKTHQRQMKDMEAWLKKHAH